MSKRNLSPDGRRRLREAALRNRPWRFASGPKSKSGKARSRCNAIRTGLHVNEPGVIDDVSMVKAYATGALIKYAAAWDGYPPNRSAAQRLADLDRLHQRVKKWTLRVLELDPSDDWASSLAERHGWTMHGSSD